MTSNLDTAPLTDAAAPPALTPGGRSAMRSLLVVTAIVVTLSAAAGIGGLAWGISSVRVAAEEALTWAGACRPGDGLGTAPSGAFPGRRTVNSELVRTRGIRLFN